MTARRENGRRVAPVYDGKPLTEALAFRAWNPVLRAAAAAGCPVAAAEIERRAGRRIQKKHAAMSEALDRVCPPPVETPNVDPYACPYCAPGAACECSL